MTIRMKSRIPGLMDDVETSVRVSLPVHVAQWLDEYLDRTAEEGSCWQSDDPRNLETVRERLGEVLT